MLVGWLVGWFVGCLAEAAAAYLGRAPAAPSVGWTTNKENIHRSIDE